VVADFTPSCTLGSACANNSVTMQKGATSGKVVQVQVRVSKLLTSIAEAALLVGYDSTALQYQGYTEGAALGVSSCGSPPCTQYLVTNNVAAGEVLADIVPPAGGVNLSSAQVAITLTFKVLKATSTSLVFKNPDTLSGSALYAPGFNIILLTGVGGGWSGGLATGT
jgi:hypothetical protein